MKTFRAASPFIAAVLFLSISLPAFAAAGDTANALRALAPSLTEGRSARIGDAPLTQPALLAALYAQRDYKPLWQSSDDLRALTGAIAGVTADGLIPEDYHLTALTALIGTTDQRNPEQAARLDLLATDALARLAIHLHYGKTDPRAFDRNWNISAPIAPGDFLELVSGVTAQPDMVAAARGLAPHHWFYGQLKKALSAQRAHVAKGGWPTTESGETLKPGMTDPRVAALRTRLAASGEYTAPAPADPDLYDDGLVTAVKRFQELHGLDTDGAVGKRTISELNVTAQERVDQVRVNLERARWVMNQIGDEFVIVNISGFHLYVIKDGVPVWDSRVVVGRTYRQTEMFKSNMRTVVLNPTWTVPPTILKQDLLPKIARDPSYLASRNMRVVDGSGARVDPSTIDWQQARRRFPYSLVQGPGPDNALGRVKFLFPNEYAIYLHDTPHREIFSRADRAASSGCIRLENPMELAYYLLAGDEDWPRERIDAVLAAGKLQNIVLKQRLPIVIMYWTAQLDRDGTMRFFPDLYDRDPPVLRALGTEPKA
ncbi:L,D-transpeptidase family protein [Emcibacter sp. SYSU 3D8]|uniref:L,D-transpeptidase family protein n=1 Tax=Emcibacter sp. SYSU 3D8 TaxID=3133969 RepID=UPI0031FE7342